MDRVVALMSGGLDSAVLAGLLKSAGAAVFPLHVRYGQRAADRELASVSQQAIDLDLEPLRTIDISEYGQLHPSGITDEGLPVVAQAFLPGRNLMLLLLGAVHTMSVGASAVAIGLLDEATSLFGDQREVFLRSAQETLSLALGQQMQVIAPLRDLGKRQVVEASRLSSTYR